MSELWKRVHAESSTRGTRPTATADTAHSEIQKKADNSYGIQACNFETERLRGKFYIPSMTIKESQLYTKFHQKLGNPDRSGHRTGSHDIGDRTRTRPNTIRRQGRVLPKGSKEPLGRPAVHGSSLN